MSDQSVKLDEILSYSEPRNAAEQITATEENAAEPSFIKHRVFLNQVDCFHAKYIASVRPLLQHTQRIENVFFSI